MGDSRCPRSSWGLCGVDCRAHWWPPCWLAAEQFAVHVIADLGAVRAAGSVIFFIVAAIVGWTFSALRRYDNDRREAQEQLAKERTAVAMHEERAALADRLHD